MAEPFTGEPIGTVRDPNIWNADGTPRRPRAVGRDGEYLEEDATTSVLPFADFALGGIVVPEGRGREEIEEQNAIFMKKLRRQAMTNRGPAIGDIVHFWDGDACVAAIVTETGDMAEDGDYLTVFQPRQQAGWSVAVLHDEDKPHGTWHWPEPQ
jgi:hypothetical protein